MGLCAICLEKNILTLSFLMVRRDGMGAESALGRKFKPSSTRIEQWKWLTSPSLYIILDNVDKTKTA